MIRRALFVGLGGIGQRHLRNLRVLAGDELEILAYRVRDERAVLDDRLRVVDGEDLLDKYHVRSFSDLDRALAREPDVCFVTNPTSLHLPVAQAAAERGCHLFVEKPLSHSLEGVKRLLAILKENGRVGFVAYQWRFHPAFARLSELLAGGLIGEVLSGLVEVGEYLPAFHPYEDYRRMYASRAELGGGVTLSQIHEIDYLTALLGRPKRVFSMGGHLSALEVDVDDVSSSLLEFERRDGGSAVVHLHQDYLQRPKVRGCRLIGQRGKLEWNLVEGTLRHFDSEGELVEAEDYTAVPRNQPYLDELRYFLDCIELGDAPRPSIADGALGLQVALAILRSQSSGEAVEIPQEAT